MEAMILPPAPSPEDDQGPIDSHQEVPTTTATSDDRPTPQHFAILTPVQSTSRDIPASIVPPSLSTPRASKRRAAPAEGRFFKIIFYYYCYHHRIGCRRHIWVILGKG